MPDKTGAIEYAQRVSIDAITALRDILIDPLQKASDRINAARVVLDRGYGRTAQQVVVSGGVAHVDVSAALATAIAAASTDASRIIEGDATSLPQLAQPEKS